MDVVLLAARLLLAGVFATAGGAKLLDRPGSRKALAGFGLPAWVATPGATLLPLAELAIAATLIPTMTATRAAAGGMVLLLLFVAGMAVNLARGRRPDCHCFGQLHSAPAGWSTLGRNGLLAVVAGFIVVGGKGGGGSSAIAWAGELGGVERAMLGAGLVLAASLVGLAWVALNLLRQHGRLLLRIESLEQALEARRGAGGLAAAPAGGLPVGSRAPTFALPDLDGNDVSLDVLRAKGKPVLLVFTDPSCSPCTALAPELGRWEQEHGSQLTIALVSRGSATANRAKIAGHGVESVLVQKEREIDELYHVSGTPSAVLVGVDGTVASPVASGAEAIRALLLRSLAVHLPAPTSAGNGHHGHPAAPGRGAPAPALSLPDVDGATVTLEDFRGRSTLVLFWNPGCGFCQQMLPDLRAWEMSRPADSPTLLVVSTGTVEANRRMGLRSRVVLDEGFVAGRAFGAAGTPSAVLVDAEGLVGSEVGAGAARVLSLARGEESVGVRGRA